MTNYVKIPGLVAEYVSKELADKLRRGYHRTLQQDGGYTIYVSENGNDDNEGTQEAPLRHVSKALNRASEIKTTRTSILTISFLSDYHDSSELLYINNPTTYLKIDGTGHDVEVGYIEVTGGGRLRVEGVTVNITSIPSNKGIYVTHGSSLLLRNVQVIVNQGSGIDVCIEASDNGLCFIEGSCSFTNNTQSEINTVFRVRDQAAFYDNADAVNISGSFNCVYHIYDIGYVIHVRSKYTATNGTPAAFKLLSGSTIKLGGKGNEFVTGGTAGTTDDTAIIIPN